MISAGELRATYMGGIEEVMKKIDAEVKQAATRGEFGTIITLPDGYENEVFRRLRILGYQMKPVMKNSLRHHRVTWREE